MQDIPINWLALIAAAAIHFVVGALWYSPILFVRQFQSLTGTTDADMKSAMPKGVVLGAVTSLVMAFVLVHAVKYAGAKSIPEGMMVGFFNWLGFIATVQLGAVLWAKQSMKLYAITVGAELVSLLLMGGLLAAWP